MKLKRQYGEWLMWGGLGLLCLLATNCATTTDPRDGGFFNGMSGLNSRAYEERIQEQEQSLNQEKSHGQEIKDRNDQLQREKIQLEESIRAATTRLEELDRSVSSARQRVANAKSFRKEDRQKLTNLEKKLQESRAQISVVQASDKPVDEARKEVEDIESQMDEMMNLVNSIGGN